MRRALSWVVAIPLMLAGSQTAHVLAYRWAYPGSPARLRELVLTGHGYLDYTPIVFAFAGAALLVSFALAVSDGARGRTLRPLPPWAFACLPPLAFTLQEHLERWLHTGVFPWYTLLGPTFLPGLLLQLPFGLVAFVISRLLLRTAERIGRALAAPATASRRFLRVSAPPAEPELPRPSLLGCRLAERGPPPAVLG